MKTHLKWAAAVLVVCMAVLLAPPLSRAEGTGQRIAVGPKENLVEVIKTAQNGDTIVLNAGCHATLGNDTPWVIDKSVTFEGGDVTLWVGGIILDADVTFRNTSLGFDGFVRNAIMANGHTLTLENVTCKTSARPLNLFCGGLHDETLGSTQCSAGTVIIRGRTSLEGSINKVTNEVGNIYAGNLCMGGMNENVSNVDGPANICQGDAEIIIEADSESTLGKIYAGGAQQRIPAGAANGKVILTNHEAYKVSGTVRVQLHASSVDYVNGLGAKETHVTYTDTRDYKYLMDGLGIYCVSSLTVKSGHVSPKADSSFVDGASLTVNPGAKLGLEQMGNVTVGSFTGGGKLSLGQGQTLNVTGDVAGSTYVAIGGFNHEDGSLRQPVAGHIYISAPLSQTQETAFVLVPPSGQIMAFTYNSEKGEWFSETGQDAEPTVVSTLKFETERAFAASGATEAAMTVVADESAVLDFLPVTIHVNGMPTEFVVDYFYNEVYRYQADGFVLLLWLAGTWPDEEPCLSVVPEDVDSTIPNGEYRIELTVPGSNTASGVSITATATLQVGGDGTISGISTGGGTGNTVRICLAAPGGPVTAGTVMAAVYDGAGRLLSFGEVPFPAEFSDEYYNGEAIPVDVPVTLSGGKTIRVFAADEKKPLCQSQSMNLN